MEKGSHSLLLSDFEEVSRHFFFWFCFWWGLGTLSRKDRKTKDRLPLSPPSIRLPLRIFPTSTYQNAGFPSHSFIIIFARSLLPSISASPTSSPPVSSFSIFLFYYIRSLALSHQTTHRPIGHAKKHTCSHRAVRASGGSLHNEILPPESSSPKASHTNPIKTTTNAAPLHRIPPSLPPSLSLKPHNGTWPSSGSTT